MLVPHHALVLVADGRKWMLFRNDGPLDQIILRTESYEERQDRKDSEIKTDAPGIRGQRFGFARPAMEETNFHQQAEDQFAADIAAMLTARVHSGDFDKLIVIADPHTLGRLRTLWPQDIAARIVSEIPKDMTNRPTADIEALLAGEAHPPA